jgi:hypothetical protein
MNELNILRRDLLDMSMRHLGEPIGHRCENLRQQINAYAITQDEELRALLEKNIRRQWADLIGLTGGMQ